MLKFKFFRWLSHFYRLYLPKNRTLQIKNYANNHLDKADGVQITEDDVFVVWICKVLQNNKALVSTTLNDGMYYEITHNGDKNETYIDCYKKWENYVFKY